MIEFITFKKEIEISELRKKIRKELDPMLKDLVFGDAGTNIIEGIANKYEIDFYDLSDFSLLFSLFLTKIITPQEFVNELFTFVHEDYFPQFMQELEDKLWSPYDVYLNKAGVVYKQLTKLTPQPISQEPSDSARLIQEQVESDKQLPSIQSADLPPETTRVPVDSSSPSVPLIQPTLQGVVISDLASPAVKPEFNAAAVQEETIFAPASPNINSQLSAARVKFDVPKTGPEIQKPTSFEIRSPLQEVKFSGPEIGPEVKQNVSASTPGTQNQTEKVVKIPRAPEIKKTDVSGRQVIDLTNFGLTESGKNS